MESTTARRMAEEYVNRQLTTLKEYGSAKNISEEERETMIRSAMSAIGFGEASGARSR